MAGLSAGGAYRYTPTGGIMGGRTNRRWSPGSPAAAPPPGAPLSTTAREVLPTSPYTETRKTWNPVKGGWETATSTVNPTSGSPPLPRDAGSGSPGAALPNASAGFDEFIRLRAETRRRQEEAAHAAALQRQQEEAQFGYQQQLQQAELAAQAQEATARRAQEEAMLRLQAEMAGRARQEGLAALRGAMGSPEEAGAITAADAAEYGRAKDQIGLQQQGALRSLRSLMGSRGISGSGIEAAGMGGVVTAGQMGLGEASRDQATERERRRQEVEDRNLRLLADFYSQYGRAF